MLDPRKPKEPIPQSHHCRVAVIWIDWYPYHVARFIGLDSAPSLRGSVVGIELVGGIGVHAGLKFREDLPSGLAIQTLQPDTNWAKANKLSLSRDLWRRLSKLNPEVVLVPGYYTLPAIAAALWARLHGRSSVLMTESTAYDHKRTWWKEAAKRLLIRCLFNWAVAGGAEHVEYLRQLGFPADRTVGRYDVVDNRMYQDGCAALREGSESEFIPRRRSFLYVGRFAPEKNVMGLLSTWLEYRRQGGAWPLVLVGDGPLGPALREAAGASGYASEISFPGLKSSRELLPFYAFAGCFVLPSTREPWGLVVNEAMASGLPVLVSDRCGCARDLVHPGQNGFVFDPSDAGALLPLLHCMENRSDAQWQAMSRASQEIVRGYSPQNFGLEIARIADFRGAEPSPGVLEGSR